MAARRRHGRADAALSWPALGCHRGGLAALRPAKAAGHWRVCWHGQGVPDNVWETPRPKYGVATFLEISEATPSPADNNPGRLALQRVGLRRPLPFADAKEC